MDGSRSSRASHCNPTPRTTIMPIPNRMSVFTRPGPRLAGPRPAGETYRAPRPPPAGPSRESKHDTVAALWSERLAVPLAGSGRRAGGTANAQARAGATT